VNPIASLLERVGRYAGHGINHEDEPFHAELEIARLLDAQGVTLKFRAETIDGTVLHDERTWIARDADGQVALWSIHINGGAVRKHEQRNGAGIDGADATLVFGVGDAARMDAYREEIAIDLWGDGDVSYRTAWGLPGGRMVRRSDVRMHRLDG
jgi:hypothetical protein